MRQFEPALLTPLRVAQLLLTSQSGMTGELDRLEEQGLIQRETIEHRGASSGWTATWRPPTAVAIAPFL